jgi:NADPH-dependent ferric siderophore reductase
MTETNLLPQPDLSVKRVRYPLKFRLLRVKKVTSISPALVRVTLVGDDLEGFQSASFDDHVKVFFPPPGTDRPTLPEVGPNGPVFADLRDRPIARDFTPRRYDPDSRELDLEFALHPAGPATTWAAQARPGQYLGIGGPRGSMIIPSEYEWHLLIGDETALPAISRRLEELPKTARVASLIEVADASGQFELPTRAKHYSQWFIRNGAPAESSDLMQALAGMPLPDGEGYVWVAGESAMVRAVYRFLRDQLGVDKSRIRAASYWRRGTDASHEKFED